MSGKKEVGSRSYSRNDGKVRADMDFVEVSPVEIEMTGVIDRMNVNGIIETDPESGQWRISHANPSSLNSAQRDAILFAATELYPTGHAGR